jgi:predicted DNA binding protein
MEFYMREVVLRLIIPNNWIKEISPNYNFSIKCIECMPHGDDGGRGLFEIKGAVNQKKMLQDLKNHSSVIKVEMCSLNENVMICSVFSKKCVACRSLEASDCYLVSGKILGDGSVEWRIITGDEGSLAFLVNIKKLSNIFKISPSTLGEILQRGEKKVLYEHFRKLYNIPFFSYFPRLF